VKFEKLIADLLNQDASHIEDRIWGGATRLAVCEDAVVAIYVGTKPPLFFACQNAL